MQTAITGGIAEGKSTVLGYVAELGYSTLSADSVAREVFSDPAINCQLALEAGQSAPIAPGSLRDALVKNPIIRRAVNRIMHPKIMEIIRASGSQFVEVPLLIETCLYSQFDHVWVVTCSPEEQRRRLADRYGDAFDGELLLTSQLRTEVKIPFADEVFRTNRPAQTVRRNVSEALARRFEMG